MRFFFKVFFFVILAVIVSFSMGGYFLITSMFDDALNTEIDAAVDENRSLRQTFEATVAASRPDQNRQAAYGKILGLAREVFGQMDGGRSTLTVYDEAFQPVYGQPGPNAGYLYELDDDARGVLIDRDGPAYRLYVFCTASPTEENLFYIETCRDITSIYSARANQLEIFRYILLLLVGFDGLVILLISFLLTRPIHKLARATRALAKGDLSRRARVRSRDEIGQLADDFNDMANEIEGKVLALEDANRRQEDFIASFAHELKTPLTSMIGYADMLRSRSLPEEDRFLSAQYIFSEGKRLEALSLKLLELLVLRKNEFPMRQVPAVWLFTRLEQAMQQVMQQEDILFRVSAEEAMLRVEPDLFQTLLMNLADNARKAIDGGGVVTVEGRSTEDGYCIYVRDSGKGISPEHLSKITEPFFMGEKSRARQKGGAGLGLAICAEIARLHGAQIGFQSTPGKGTLVKILLRGDAA